jgi:hypothetical protein
MALISEALKRHEGCNIHGWLEVERVAGNIHFSVKPDALFLSMTTEGVKQVRVLLWRWCGCLVGHGAAVPCGECSRNCAGVSTVQV